MDKIKEGVSVKELESFARKYTVEGFIILSLIIATLSSGFGFFTGAGWSVVFAGIGAIISVAFPEAVWRIVKPLFNFTCKQDKATQIIVGVVRLIFAIFIPFLIFLEIAILGGIAFHLPPSEKAKFTKRKESTAKQKEEEK